MSTKITKAGQARNLTGTQTRDALDPIRSAVLIAKLNAASYNDPTAQRVWWAKSDYPTLQAAEEALTDVGIEPGLSFTQYGSGRYTFDSLKEIIEAAALKLATDAPAPALKLKVTKASKPAGDGRRWPEGTKRCPRCTDTKPRSEFASNVSAKDGAFSICKGCERIDRKRRADAKKGASAKPTAPSAKPKASAKATPKPTPRRTRSKPKA